MKSAFMNTEHTAKKQDVINNIISELKTINTKVCFYEDIAFGVLKNGKDVHFNSIEYNTNDNNVYLIDYYDNRYNIIEWVPDFEIEWLSDCVTETCEMYRVCEKIKSIGKCIKFNTPIILVKCKDLGVCGVDKIEYIDNRLYLFCGRNIFNAMEWLDYPCDWQTLKLAVDNYENIEISDKNSDIIYAVSATIYDEYDDDFGSVIISKFYTDINLAIAEKERIDKLSDNEKRKLHPCNHNIDIDICDLDITVYELIK